MEHIIAGKAVALKEALSPEFKEYAKQIVKNAKAMAQGLLDNGMDIVGGMTENHLMSPMSTARMNAVMKSMSAYAKNFTSRLFIVLFFIRVGRCLQHRCKCHDYEADAP